jgi:glycosyltransferase involved in cell wall biosynthesis
VRALARLRDGVPAATLDVVGEHPRLDGPGVTGHGPLPIGDRHASEKLERLFESSTCCVMPSRFEPFGIVHAEAAAAGIPSVGTTVGGPAEVIGPDAGILVPPGDEEALLAAMTRLADPEIASRMGAAALERSSRFTWDAVAERVLRALGRPLPVRRPAGAQAPRAVAE